MNILDQTYELLDASPTSVPQIAAACGLKPRWLYRLKDRDYDDPGVQKIEKLHRYLKNEKRRSAA